MSGEYGGAVYSVYRTATIIVLRQATEKPDNHPGIRACRDAGPERQLGSFSPSEAVGMADTFIQVLS